MPESTVESQLQEIKKRADAIDRPAETTLEILGEASLERAWEDLLVYFLDPGNTHGLGTEPLAAFLKALSDVDGTSLSGIHDDLDEVEVQSQVPTEDGPFDILLWSKDAWYIVIEMKVGAPETGNQLEHYAQATHLGDLVVSQHDGEGEYIYLAPESTRSSPSNRFTDVSWRHIIPYLDDVTDPPTQYPSRSHAQLTDFIDTIRRTLNMEEFTSVSEETRLYTEYSETIDQLIEAYENDKANLFNRIKTAFFAELDGNREDWTVSNRGNSYINFAKEDWNSVAGGVTIEYEPHVNLNRENPDIRLRLDIEHGNKDQIRNGLHQRLSQNNLEALEDRDWEFVDENYAFIAKSVPLSLDRPDESIRDAIHELHEFRSIVEPSIDEIVTEYQNP